MPRDGEQPDRRRRLLAARAPRSSPSRAAQRSAASLALLEVGDPLAAAVGPLDARDEARHHRLQLAQDHPAVVARLGQRRGHQAQEQLLVGLAGGEDAHVRQRGGRQQAAQQVERLRLDRAQVRRLRLAVARAGSARRPTPRPAAGCARRCRTGSPSPARTRARARGRASSGSRRPASRRRRGCSGWTARGRRPAGRAGAPWSSRSRPTRRRCGRRRAGPRSRRRSRGRSARRAWPRARPRRRRTPGAPASTSPANSSR